MASSRVLRFPASLRRLARDGVEALKPQLVIYNSSSNNINSKNIITCNKVIASSSLAAAATAAPPLSATPTPVSQDGNTTTITNDNIDDNTTSDAPRCWHKPKISRRKAHVLRKQAIRDGTYGTFLGPHEGGGGGWDPAWDAVLLKKQQPDHHRDAASSSLGRYRLTIPKKTSRQRTREQRASKIDKNMDGMDERIEEYYAAKHAAKPPDTTENRYKKLMRVQK